MIKRHVNIDGDLIQYGILPSCHYVNVAVTKVCLHAIPRSTYFACLCCP